MRPKVLNAEKRKALPDAADRALKKPLKGRHVFLHLQGYRGSSQFERDLVLLGGVVEKCFSREVNCVVTNRGTPADYERRPRDDSKLVVAAGGVGSKAGPAGVAAVLRAPSPVTPSPSPFSLGGLGIESPPGPSPGSVEVGGGGDGRRKAPLTRGMAIAQAAKSTKCYGTMDVIEMARLWKIKIIHVDSAIQWVKKQLEKIPEEARLGNAHENNTKRTYKVQKLLGSHVKYESCSKHYKPMWQEFQALPSVRFDSVPGTCPFLKDRQTTKMDEGGEVEEERDVQCVPELLNCDEASTGVAQKKTYARRRDKKRKSEEDWFGRQVLTAGEVRRMMQDKKRAEAKKGYCEVCQIKYDDINKHLSSDRHRAFWRDDSRYAGLDRLIKKGPNVQQLISKVLDAHEAKAALHLMPTRNVDEVVLLSEGSLSHVESPKQNKKKTPNKKLTPRRTCLNYQLGKEVKPSPLHITGAESPVAIKSPPRRTLRGKTVQAERPSTPGRTHDGKDSAESSSKSAEAQLSLKGKSNSSEEEETQHTPSRNTRASASRREGAHCQVPPSLPAQNSNTGHALVAGAEKYQEEDMSHSRRTRSKSVSTPVEEVKVSLDRIQADQHPECDQQMSSLESDAESGDISQSVNRVPTVVIPSHEITPATRQRIQDLLQKEGTPRVVCSKLDLAEMEDFLPVSCQTSSKQVEMKVSTQLRSAEVVKIDTVHCSQAELEPVEPEGKTVSEPVRRLRSSQRSRSRSRSKTEDKSLSQDSGAGHQITRDSSSEKRTPLSTIFKIKSVSPLPVKNKHTDSHKAQAEEIESNPEKFERITRSRTKSEPKGLTAKSLSKLESNHYVSPQKSIVKENSQERSKVGVEDPSAGQFQSASEKPRTPRQKPPTLRQSGSSQRRVKLKHNWSLVSQRSIKKILESESEGDFEGFSKEAVNDGCPLKDASYEEVSVVEPGDDSDTEWIISGESIVTNAHESSGGGKSPRVVIPHGLDESCSSPQPGSTGVTPIKHILKDVSAVVMSEASSSGWDENLDDYLDGRLKHQQQQRDQPHVSTFTSILNQTKNSPRRSPRKSPWKKTQSPYKFVASPRVQRLKAASSVADKHSPRTGMPTMASSFNRTLDFSSPHFSILDELPEAEPLWVGPTANEKAARSYVQKAADRLSRTPNQRTPVYHKAHSTPIPVKVSEGQKIQVSPFTSRPNWKQQAPDGPVSKDVKVNYSPQAVRAKVDDEVEFNFSSPQKHVADTLNEFTLPSPVTPLGNTPASRYTSSCAKVGTPSNADLEDRETLEPPRKKLITCVSSTKKKISLGFMPAFEFKSSSQTTPTSRRDLTPSGKSSVVKLTSLGRSVTPRVNGAGDFTPRSIKTSTSAGPLRKSPRKTQQVSSNSPNGGQQTPKTSISASHTSGGRLEASSVKSPASSSSCMSTPRITSPGRKLNKLLTLHSLEDIQCGPRRKSSNVTSIVRFHADSSDDEDQVVLKSITAKCTSNENQENTTKQTISLAKDSKPAEVKSSCSEVMKPTTTTPSSEGYLRRPSNLKRANSAVGYTSKWAKTKYRDWSQSTDLQRSKSVGRLSLKKTSPGTRRDHRLSLRRSCSPRKQLQMDPTFKKSVRLSRSQSKTRATLSSRPKRSVSKDVSYYDFGSDD